jgi:hypothetical protein
MLDGVKIAWWSGDPRYVSMICTRRELYRIRNCSVNFVILEMAAVIL